MTEPSVLPIFYTSAHSLYCAKVRIILRHKDVAFDERSPPGGGGSATYLALVPSGNLPAYVDGDLTLTDSEAIAEYLEEKHPMPALLPRDLPARALARERSRFADTRLEPALRLTFPHVAPEGRDEGVIATAHALINKRLAQLAEMLTRSPLPRDRLCIGDPGTVVTLEWTRLFEGPVVPPLHWPEAVTRYLKDMEQHDAVRAELAAYRPEMQAYMIEKGAV